MSVLFAGPKAGDRAPDIRFDKIPPEQGELQGRDFLVPLEIITDACSTQHQRLAELRVLDFSKTVSDAARARFWILIAMALTLLGAGMQLVQLRPTHKQPATCADCARLNDPAPTQGKPIAPSPQQPERPR